MQIPALRSLPLKNALWDLLADVVQPQEGTLPQVKSFVIHTGISKDVIYSQHR